MILNSVPREKAAEEKVRRHGSKKRIKDHAQERNERNEEGF